MKEPSGGNVDSLSMSPNILNSHPTSLLQRSHQWAFSPSPSTNRGVDFFRICLRIFLIMYQDFFHTHLAIRASALTYSIVLSLVPILALSTAILKGLGNEEQLKLAAIRVIEQTETPPSLLKKEDKIPDIDQAQVSLTAHLHHAVDVIFQYVDRTNFAALGILGVIGLFGSVILVLSSIENAMNAIWHTHKDRSIFKTIMDYLALLILLPISLNIALAAEAVLASKKIMSHINVIIPTAWAVTFLIKLVPFAFIVLTLMIMYLFFPHVKVKTGSALAGAVFASIFWFIFQKIYITLQIGVAGYNAIYGSFATIPLFLIWLQIGWTFILLGASLAHAIQHHHHYCFSTSTLSPQQRLQTAFDILLTVYGNFEKRLPTPLALLNKKFPNRYAEIKAVTTQLINGHLLCYKGSAHEKMLIPVTSAEKLRASEVVRLIFGGEVAPTTGGHLAAQAVEAAKNAVHSNHFITNHFRLSNHETGPASNHT